MKEAQWQKILRRKERRNRAALRNKRAATDIPTIEQQYNIKIKVKGVKYA